MLDDLAVDFPDAKLAVLGQTAEWLVFQGDWTAAEERYRTLLTLVDETSLIDRLLSRLLIRQGRQVEARVLLQRLCKAGNVEETTRFSFRSRYSNGIVRINLPILPQFEISARNDKTN